MSSTSAQSSPRNSINSSFSSASTFDATRYPRSTYEFDGCGYGQRSNLPAVYAQPPSALDTRSVYEHDQRLNGSRTSITRPGSSVSSISASSIPAKAVFRLTYEFDGEGFGHINAKKAIASFFQRR